MSGLWERLRQGVGMGLGLLLALLAPMFVLRPTKFAVVYTLGNLLSIGSALFLAGPSKQLGNMFHTRRRISTLVYLTTLVLTLVSAFALHSAILCLVCIAAQFAALAWYCLSYIPYGQSLVLRAVGRQVDDGTGAW